MNLTPPIFQVGNIIRDWKGNFYKVYHVQKETWGNTLHCKLIMNKHYEPKNGRVMRQFSGGSLVDKSVLDDLRIGTRKAYQKQLDALDILEKLV